MSKADLIKAFAKLEGVDLIKHPKYEPMSPALNCAARDKYKVSIEYQTHGIVFTCRNAWWHDADLDCDICHEVIKIIVEGYGEDENE